MNFASNSRKRCPVYKVFRTYSGVTCPPCTPYFEEVDGRIRRKPSIHDYLPKKSGKMLIQGRVDLNLFAQVKKLMEKDQITWPALLTACLMRYRDERKTQQAVVKPAGSRYPKREN